MKWGQIYPSYRGHPNLSQPGIDRSTLTGQLAQDVATLSGGMQAITGRKEVLGRRYGELAAGVRDAGGSLFDFETDAWAREVTARIGAADKDLGRSIAERSVQPKAAA